MSAVEKAAEAAVDVVEEALDTAGHVKPGSFNLNGMTKGQHATLLVGALVIGAGTGGFFGYFFTKKFLTTKYEIIAAKEAADAKAFYGRLHKTDENDETLSPQQVLEDKLGREAVDALRGYSPSANDVDGPYASEEELEQLRELRENRRDGKLEDAEAPTNVVSHNIFTDADRHADSWDYEQELRIRESNPTRPYIISKEEFLEGETGYEQADMVYFQGDNVLADDQQIPVNDTESLVGDDNLERFGHGSGDSKMLYIRNDNTEMEYEIALSTGEYTREVLGLVEVDETDKELKHSHSRNPRKFRERDFE